MPMKYLLILALWSFGILHSSFAVEQRPNVVFILADDLGWADTTLYGYTKFHKTPNIERLAKRGMTFTHAYSAIILRWAEELAEMSDYDITILDASFPETLEIAGEAQPELFMAALRHFMKGGRKLPPAMSTLSAAVVKELRTAFAESSLRVLVV